MTLFFVFVVFTLFCSFFLFSFLSSPSSVATTNQYDLTVVASDTLNESECTVVVYVRDINDLAPVFDREHYFANITEETVFRNRPLLQVLKADGTWIQHLHFTKNSHFCLLACRHAHAH